MVEKLNKKIINNQGIDKKETKKPNHTCLVHQKINKKKLIKKGWSLSDIKNTLKYFHLAESKKSKFVKRIDLFIYWIILLVVIVTNFVLSVMLVPVLVLMSGFYLVFTITFVGVVFGYLFTQMVKEVEHFQKQHLIVSELLIPAIGLSNVYIIAKLSNTMAVLAGLPTPSHNPIFISVLYVLAFSTPRIYHIFMRFRLQHELREIRRDQKS